MSAAPFVPVAPGVLVATSEVMSTTTTLIVRAGRGVLVDPAWRAGELVALADDLDALGAEVTAGVSTHPHHDHLLWHPRFGPAPRWACPRAVTAATEHRAELLGALLDAEDYPSEVVAAFATLSPVPGADRPGSVSPLPEPFGPDGPVEPIELIGHDAHAVGHLAVWAPERGVLVVGDMLSDLELPLPFDPDDLPAYLAGLDLLAPYVARAQVLVPGHGMPTFAPMDRLDADRRYLDALLAGRDPEDPRRANPGMADVHDRLVGLARLA